MAAAACVVAAAAAPSSQQSAPGASQQTIPGLESSHGCAPAMERRPEVPQDTTLCESDRPEHLG
eukprot:1581186-Alexandrium_andersonii.AAC.1